MDITLMLNGNDWSAKVSTYNFAYETKYAKIVKTLDNNEHALGGYQHGILTFSLFPLTEEESAALYNDLSQLLIPVTYSNPYKAKSETRQMRIASNLESKFALISVDGKRRYLGGKIELR